MGPDPRVDDLVWAWEQAQAEGRAASPTELCRDCPDLIPAVAARLDALRRVSNLSETANLDPPDPSITSDARPSINGKSTPDNHSTLPEVRVVAGYSIEAELGRGGMGVVYRATQVGLNRPVALKMLLKDCRGDGREIIRFLAEAEAVAAVRHPHVVQVYDFGDTEGRPYLALEFCPGGTLTDRLAGGRLDSRTATELLEAVARGVAAAHDQGIVHRDLKPGNVLFDTAGSPKVADFGLAKRGSGSDMTRTGAVMGTPAYMAPEQAKGENKFVGPPADVWSLGVMLYEALTGQRPFTGNDMHALLFQVIEKEPRRPRAVDPGVPRDLELICLKCLAKPPTERYPTAAALADELRKWLDGLPVTVRAAGPVERAAKWARRKPTMAAAISLGVLAATFGGLGTLAAWQWQQAESARGQSEDARENESQARQAAEQAKQQAETARDGEFTARQTAEQAREGEKTARKSTEQALAALRREQTKTAAFEFGRTLQVAQQECRENNFEAARSLLESTRPEFRDGWEWRYLHRLCHGQLLTFKGHPARVATFVSPDGKRVVTTSETDDLTVQVRNADSGAEVTAFKLPRGPMEVAAFSPDGQLIATSSGSVHLWDATIGTELRTLAPTSHVRTMSFSPDSRRVLTTGVDRSARVWDAETGAELVAFKGHTGEVVAASFSPDGRRVLSASGKMVRVWDAETGAEVADLKGIIGDVIAASFSPDGRRIVTTGYDMARVWDAESGKLVVAIRGHIGPVFVARFSPDGQSIITTGRDGTARVSNASNGATVTTFKGHIGSVAAARFSPDGRRIVTAGADGTARVWDAATGAERIVLKGHKGDVVGVWFSPDGRKVITAGRDRTARVWDATTAAERLDLKSHRGEVIAAVFSPDGRQVLTAGRDQLSRIHDAATGAPVASLEWTNVPLAAPSFSPDGRRVVTVNSELTARVWNTETGAEVATLKGHTSYVTSMSFSLDGRRVVTGSNYPDSTVRVWDASTGAQLAKFKEHTDSVGTARFSPDGRWIISASGDRSARIWNAETGAERLSLKGHNAPLIAASFSPDGQFVVTSARDGTARLWDASTGAERFVFQGSTGEAIPPLFSPNGRRVLTAGLDKTGRVWDVESGAEVSVLKGHTAPVTAAAFNSDGRRIITASGDRSARLWDTETGAELLVFKANTVSVTAVAFSADGRRIVTANQDGTAAIYDSDLLGIKFLP